jgi:hypothetical protein
LKRTRLTAGNTFIGLQLQWSITVGGDSFVCVPSLVCRGRVALLACFACCAV